MGKASRVKRTRAISEQQRQTTLLYRLFTEIQNADTPKQIDFIENAVKSRGATYSRMGTILRQNAPLEMRKGIARLVSNEESFRLFIERIPVVDRKSFIVDELLKEYHADKSFQKLAANAGCDEQYFVDLANRELEAYSKERRLDIIDTFKQETNKCQSQPTKQQVQARSILAELESGVHNLLRKMYRE